MEIKPHNQPDPQMVKLDASITKTVNTIGDLTGAAIQEALEELNTVMGHVPSPMLLYWYTQVFVSCEANMRLSLEANLILAEQAGAPPEFVEQMRQRGERARTQTIADMKQAPRILNTSPDGL